MCFEVRTISFAEYVRDDIFLDEEAIVVLEVDEKKTRKTTKTTIKVCQHRLKGYEEYQRQKPKK